MTRHLTILALSALILIPTAAKAQSLAEVARQEALRRQTVAQGKVITNGDLKPVPPATTPAPAPAAAGTSPAAPDTAASDAGAKSASETTADAKADAKAPADAKKDEKYWRQRMAGTRDSIARSQTFQAALESRIAALSTDFVNRDDPAQRSVIAADRVKATAELDRVKKELAQYQTDLTTIAEEARRAGAPAARVR